MFSCSFGFTSSFALWVLFSGSPPPPPPSRSSLTKRDFLIPLVCGSRSGLPVLGPLFWPADGASGLPKGSGSSFRHSPLSGIPLFFPPSSFRWFWVYHSRDCSVQEYFLFGTLLPWAFVSFTYGSSLPLSVRLFSFQYSCLRGSFQLFFGGISSGGCPLCLSLFWFSRLQLVPRPPLLFVSLSSSSCLSSPGMI